MVVGTYEKPPYEIREHSRTADIQQYTKTKGEKLSSLLRTKTW